MRFIYSLFGPLALVALAAAVPAVATAQSTSAKLDPLLQARARTLTGRSRVIVEFRGAPDVRVITQRGGVAGRRLDRPGAQVADVNNYALEALARDPNVARVRPDHDTFATLERTGAAVGAVLARQDFGVTGRGIGVAVIDSGVAASHDDLTLTGERAPRVSRRVVHFKDFTIAPNPRVWLSEVASDDFGHGTHVAGIIGGSGFDSDGRRMGVAPGAHLVALKVLDANGHGYVSDVIEAIDYAIAVRHIYNIRVINLSVATGVFESVTTDPLARAAKRAVDAGIVVVAAAGNIGANDAGEPQFGGITCPGNAPWVLTVGAANHAGTAQRRDDTRGLFSSMGPTWIDFAAKPDLVAHGVGIESLAAPHSGLYGRYPQYLLDGTRRTPFKPYLSLSGTSMAAPVVAGTVALMLEANPDLTPNAVKALLQYTAEVRAGEHALAQGAGLLNARGAVRMARFFASPTRRAPAPADLIEGESIAWSRHIIWGNVRVDGGMLLPWSSAWALDVTWGATRTPGGAPVAWGVSSPDNIVWSTGDNIVWSTADNIVWSTGDNIVWSTADNIVWSTGDNIVWSTADNIVWSTTHAENVVWGTSCGGANCQRTIWGTTVPAGGVRGTASAGDNIVWSTADNIVWSTGGDDNIVWSTGADNIVWSTGIAGPLWPTTAPATVNRRRNLPARD